MKLETLLLAFMLASGVACLAMVFHAIWTNDVEALAFFAVASTLGMIIIGLIGVKAVKGATRWCVDERRNCGEKYRIKVRLWRAR